MRKSFEFEKWQPPALTEASLRKECKKRQKRRVLLALLAVSVLNTVLLAVLFAMACRYSIAVALGLLILLCVSMICMGVTTVILVTKRGDLIYELY